VGRDSSVGTATRCGLEDRVMELVPPTDSRYYAPLLDRPWDPRSLRIMGTGSLTRR
jgi:hypothetical protein